MKQPIAGLSCCEHYGIKFFQWKHLVKWLANSKELINGCQCGHWEKGSHGKGEPKVNHQHPLPLELHNLHTTARNTSKANPAPTNKSSAHMKFMQKHGQSTLRTWRVWLTSLRMWVTRDMVWKGVIRNQPDGKAWSWCTPNSEWQT